MAFKERELAILEYLKEHKEASVENLCKVLFVSEATMRRDLTKLHNAKKLVRTHGGAIVLSQVSVRPPLNRQYDNMTIFPNYKAIAEIAVKEIKENDIVYLTCGSFGHIVISLLPKDIHFTVVVNSVDFAKELRDFENIDVYIAGGKMRKSGSLVDTFAVDFVSKLHFDVCFITGSGLTAEFGLSNGSDETATFQRTVLKNSRRKYLLLASSKIGVNSFVKVCNANEFDTIITDWDCAEEQITALEDTGVKVIVAEESK